MDKQMAEMINKMTKKQLVEKFFISAIEAKTERHRAAELQTKLDKAEAYVEQGRAMIEAVMDRWHEYDV